LTNWKLEWFVSTLAAAYAEAGDFASAVFWEQKALESSTPGFGWDEERLKLYKEGKPFRVPRSHRSSMPSLAAPKVPVLSPGAR